MIAVVYCSVLLCLLTNHVLSYPYGGGANNGQWSNPQNQQQGYGGGRQNQGFGNGGWQQGHGGYGGQRGGNFGGYSPNGAGGRQQWQSAGQGGAEAYKMNVFNEPDRYGYDYTIPGATVHYLMHKKQGNRGSGYGMDQGGWNKNY